MIPELLPVRMLNEMAYCPRLFHLEWVGAEWAPNVYTADGNYQHRRVDEPAGDLSPDDDLLREARAVDMSAPPGPPCISVGSRRRVFCELL